MKIRIFADLYANKTGVKPPKLRIVATGQEYNFVFTADEPICFTNRDDFRDRVKALIREGMTQSTGQTPGPASDPPTPSDVRHIEVCLCNLIFGGPHKIL
jgi:hypothetical protein